MSADRKIRTRIEQVSVKRIHNNLGNTAYYLQKRIAEREAAGDHTGISLEMMAALTMTAFWIEACFNFIGEKKIAGWKERAPFNKKRTQILAHCNINDDDSIRPFSSISRLKLFRDTLAHGKPETVEHSFEEIRLIGDVRQPDFLDAEWEKMLTVETVCECYEDVNSLWLQMLKAIDMDELQTSSQGSRGMVYLGEAEA